MLVDGRVFVSTDFDPPHKCGLSLGPVETLSFYPLLVRDVPL